MIRLIASDMDGTLLGADHKISPENCAAIRTAQENNVRFAIVTGRTYEDVRPLLDENALACECVLMNGGEYRDIEGNLLMGIYLDKKIVPAVLNCLKAHQFVGELYTNKGYYTPSSKEELFAGILKRIRRFYPQIQDDETIYQMAATHPHYVEMNFIEDIDAFLQTDIEIGKIVSFADTSDEITALWAELDKISGLAISSSFPTNIEINDAAATKGNILAKVAEKIGLQEDEIAVFGDGQNDTSMFEQFQNSFAMENAIDEIKKLAKYHTVKNTDHGVAAGIYRILKEKI